MVSYMIRHRASFTTTGQCRDKSCIWNILIEDEEAQIIHE